MPRPGIEPGSTDWQSGMLSTRPAHLAERVIKIQRLNHRNITKYYSIEIKAYKRPFSYTHARNLRQHKKTTFLTNSSISWVKITLEGVKITFGAVNAIFGMFRCFKGFS